MDAGYVKGFLTTHYLPEMGLEKKSKLLHFFFPALNALLGLKAKWENNDFSNVNQVIDMMAKFEEQITQANAINNNNPAYKRLVITRNFNAFNQALQAGNVPMAHAVEGGAYIQQVTYMLTALIIASPTQY